MSEIAPGWFPDPGQPGQLRWWDGQRWTEHVAPDQQQVPAQGLAPEQAVPQQLAPEQAVQPQAVQQQAAPARPRGPRIWNTGTWVTLGICVALVIAGGVAAPILVNQARNAEVRQAQEVLDGFVAAATQQDDGWRDFATPQFASRVVVGAPIGGEKNTAKALDLKVSVDVGELELFTNNWFRDTPPAPDQTDMGTAPVTITYSYTFAGKKYESTVEQLVWLARPYYYGDSKPQQADTFKQETAKGPWRVFRLGDPKDKGAQDIWSTTMTEAYDTDSMFFCDTGPEAFGDMSTHLRVDGEFVSKCLYDGGENVLVAEDLDRADLAASIPAFDPFSGVGALPEITGVGELYGGAEVTPIMEFPFEGKNGTYVATFMLVQVEGGDPHEARAALVSVQEAATPGKGKGESK